MNDPHVAAAFAPAEPPSAHSVTGLPRRWRPSAFLLVSIACHGLALIAIVARPAAWPWIVAVLVADHLAIVAAGLWPRSTLLGPNLTRLPAPAVERRWVALTFDDGPDPAVTPAVLELLARHGVHASFFCVARRAAPYPELVAQIVAAGHTVENHSDAHSHAFSLFGPWRMRRDITQAQSTLTSLTGRAPSFFRAPAGLRNPFLEPLLGALGLHYVSWSRRGYDAVSTDARAILARLTRGLRAGDILLLHDGHGARNRHGKPIVLEVLPLLLEEIERRGLRPVPLDTALRTVALPPSGSITA